MGRESIVFWGQSQGLGAARSEGAVDSRQLGGVGRGGCEGAAGPEEWGGTDLQAAGGVCWGRATSALRMACFYGRRLCP